LKTPNCKWNIIVVYPVNTRELSRTCLKVSVKLEFASVCFLEVLKSEIIAEKPLRVRVRTRT